MRLVLVRDEHVDVTQKFSRIVANRGGVQHDPGSDGAPRLGCGDHRIDRHFSLGQNHVDGAEGRQVVGDRCRIHSVVRTGNHDDSVLSGGVHFDQGGTRRPRRLCDAARVDVLAANDVEQPIPRSVVTDGSDHVNLGLQSGRGDGLVQAFSTGMALQGCPEDGFPSTGHPVEFDDKINVETAHHGNSIVHIRDTSTRDGRSGGSGCGLGHRFGESRPRG